jgi:hypothetical protein
MSWLCNSLVHISRKALWHPDCHVLLLHWIIAAICAGYPSPDQLFVVYLPIVATSLTMTLCPTVS